MILDRHGAGRPLPRPDADVLVERRGAHDARLVRPRVLIDLVRRAVGRHAAFVGPEGRRVERVFHDVVFHEGGGRPPVDGEETGAGAGAEEAVVGYWSGEGAGG